MLLCSCCRGAMHLDAVRPLHGMENSAQQGPIRLAIFRRLSHPRVAAVGVRPQLRPGIDAVFIYFSTLDFNTRFVNKKTQEASLIMRELPLLLDFRKSQPLNLAASSARERTRS